MITPQAAQKEISPTRRITFSGGINAPCEKGRPAASVQVRQKTQSGVEAVPAGGRDAVQV